MKWPWSKRIEKKAGDSLVQYQAGIYWLGSGASTSRLKDFIQGYRLNDTVYSCVNLIAQSAALVPWYVYREKSDGDVEEVDRHPLGEWMDKPGPGLDWTEFLTQSLSYYLLAGNSYIYKLIGSFGKYGQVAVLMPQFMTPKPRKDGTIDVFEYRIAGQLITYPSDQIIHVKAFNPENQLIGLSPIQVLCRKVDIARLGELWTVALLENQAQPSGGLTLGKDTHLTPDQRDKLNSELKAQFAGYENAGKPLILEGGWDWKAFSFTPKEVEFLNSKRAVMREICAAYKVAPELFGDSENKTYSNIQEARKALYQEAVIPLLGKFKNAFNEQIVPHFDDSGAIFLDYDVSGIDALSEDLNALWTRVLAAKGAGTVTRDEAREEMGYGELPGGDVLTESISIVSTPVDQLGKEPPKPEPPPPAQGDEDEEEPPPPPKKSRIVHVKGGFWQKAERKKAKWTAFNRRVMAQERALDAIAQKYLNAQGDRIAAKVKKAPSLGMVDKWNVLDQEKEAGLFVNAAMPWYVATFRHGVSTGMAAGKGEIFDGESKGDVGIWTPEFEEAVRKLILLSGTQIAETTLLSIMMELEMAEMESMTVAEFARAIQDKIEGLTPMRARRIARTETVKVENYGQLEGFRQTEFVELKGWLCAFVELSREAHMAADSQYSAAPIPLDEDFIVGGMPMAYPGDPRGGAAQVCNCLCDVFPEVKEI